MKRPNRTKGATGARDFPELIVMVPTVRCLMGIRAALAGYVQG